MARQVGQCVRVAGARLGPLMLAALICVALLACQRQEEGRTFDARSTDSPLGAAASASRVLATAAPTTASAEPITLAFWHAEADAAVTRQLQAMCDRFHQQHPNITVEAAYAGDPDEIYRKTVAAIQAGNPPDLAATYGTQATHYMSIGAIAPLEPLIDDVQIGLSREDRDDIFPGCWEAGAFPKFGGKILSFPFAKGAEALYYNRALLKNAGIKEVPKTWEEFEKACKAVSKGDVKGYAYYESASTFDAWLNSRGVGQLSDDESKAIFNGPEGVESLELLNRLIKAGAALRPAGSYADQAMFAQGKAAFVMGSTSGISYIAGAIKRAGTTFEWGATLLPQKDPATPRTVMYGADVCIFKTGEARQRAAWMFIKWFTGTDQTAEWGSTSGYTPIRRSAVKKLAGSGWLDKNPVVKEVYNAVIPYAYPEPNARGEQEIRDSIVNAWMASATGAKTPKQALDEAVVKANDALATKK